MTLRYIFWYQNVTELPKTLVVRGLMKAAKVWFFVWSRMLESLTKLFNILGVMFLYKNFTKI